MKKIYHTLIILCLLFSCKKSDDPSGGPQQMLPVAAYTCYLSSIEDYDHVVTNRYTYNDDHFLSKHEVFQNGLPDETWLYYQNVTEHWIREDHFVHDVGGDYYQSYKKFYFNQQQKIDSMVEYQCVDCGKLNPTIFSRAWYWIYAYDDSLRLTKSQYYSLPHQPNGYTEFEYDDQGRISKETAREQDGKVDFYYAYRYTNIDSLKMLTGEPSAITKGLFGYSRVYRELFTDYYNGATGKTEVVQWDNQRNPDGYMNATANSKYGTLIAYYKYACFKN